MAYATVDARQELAKMAIVRSEITGLYHGSNVHGLAKLTESKSGDYGAGVYLGDKTVGENWARHKGGQDGSLYECKLNDVRLLEVDDTSENNKKVINVISRALKELAADPATIPAVAKEALAVHDEFVDVTRRLWGTAFDSGHTTRKALLLLGFDGALITSDSFVMAYVVYNADKVQIVNETREPVLRR